MTIIITIICTILAYQLIFAIVDIATNENEKVLIPFGFGIWALLFAGAFWIINKIKLAYYRKYYDTFSFWFKDKQGIPQHWHNYYVHKKAQKFFNIDDNKTHFCTKMRDGKGYQSVPVKDYCINKHGKNCQISKDYFARWKNDN